MSGIEAVAAEYGIWNRPLTRATVTTSSAIKHQRFLMERILWPSVTVGREATMVYEYVLTLYDHIRGA